MIPKFGRKYRQLPVSSFWMIRNMYFFVWNLCPSGIWDHDLWDPEQLTLQLRGHQQYLAKVQIWKLVKKIYRTFDKRTLNFSLALIKKKTVTELSWIYWVTSIIYSTRIWMQLFAKIMCFGVSGQSWYTYRLFISTGFSPHLMITGGRRCGVSCRLMFWFYQ